VSRLHAPLGRPAKGLELLDLLPRGGDALEVRVTLVSAYELNGEPLPAGAPTRALDDPWEGIVDAAAARTTLGFRPDLPNRVHREGRRSAMTSAARRAADQRRRVSGSVRSAPLDRTA
jgi:hypothetical protein